MGYRNRRVDAIEMRFLAVLYVYLALLALGFGAMLAGDLATMCVALIMVLVGGVVWLGAILGYQLYSLFVC